MTNNHVTFDRQIPCTQHVSTSKMLRLQRAFCIGKVWHALLKESNHLSFNAVIQRAYHDLVTLPGNKPITSSGPPGYSAVSGHRVTVFGVTGFLGRYFVSKLGLCSARALRTLIFPCCKENWVHRSLFLTVMKTKPVFSSQWEILVKLFEWFVCSCLGIIKTHFYAQHCRSGISVMRIPLPSVCGIRIPSTISSEGIMKPSTFNFFSALVSVNKIHTGTSITSQCT